MSLINAKKPWHKSKSLWCGFQKMFAKVNTLTEDHEKFGGNVKKVLALLFTPPHHSAHGWG